MEKKSIKFYFDFSSPYAYFSIEKLEQIAKENNCEIEWFPFLLGVALQKSGNSALADQPIKDQYAYTDWDRLSRFLSVPWKLPDLFPINSLSAARCFYLVKNEDKALSTALAKKIFSSYFVRNKDITSYEVLSEIAAETGFNKVNLETLINKDEIKLCLRAETEKAINIGVFGSPTFIIENELFWGSDRLWMLKRWLRSGGW